MKFFYEAGIAILALTNVAVADVPSRRWMGSISARANHASLTRRQIEIGGLRLGGGGNVTEGIAGGQGNGGGLTIGGLTLGGENGGIAGNGIRPPVETGNVQDEVGEAGAADQNGTAVGEAPQKPPAVPEVEEPANEAGIAEASKPGENGTTIELASAQEPQATPTESQSAEESKVPAAAELVPAEQQTGAGAGTDNQPGRAEGEAAAKEAQKEAAAAEDEKTKAEEESERFSEDAGITLNGDGSTANLGGNLGITHGSDGSISVGGENGITIAPDGTATTAGTEKE